jgi:hypothetical protein
MHRRLLLASGLAFLGAGKALAQSDTGVTRSDIPPTGGPDQPAYRGGGDSQDNGYGGDDRGDRRYDDRSDRSGGGDSYSRDDRYDRGDRYGDADDHNMPPPETGRPTYRAPTYTRDELANSVSDFFGVTTEAAASIVERIFRDNGRPTGYIAGTEGSAAFFGGLRYGNGLLYMKDRPPQKVYWRGPSIGFDWGGNGARVFTLCYNLQYPDMLYRRYPGVDGSAYFIGGLGVNYQRAEDITLAPIRTGVGLRLGANVGYLAYSRNSTWVPF